MPIPQELQDAGDRMKAAQDAMHDFIDAGSGDAATRNALLQELNDSMENFMQVLQRVTNAYEHN